MTGRIRRPTGSVVMSRYAHTEKGTVHSVEIEFYLLRIEIFTYGFFYYCRCSCRFARQNRRTKRPLEYLLPLHLPRLFSLRL